MRKKKSFRPFRFFNAHLLKDPILLGAAVVSFGAGYGLQEVFREPEHQLWSKAKKVLVVQPDLPQRISIYL